MDSWVSVHGQMCLIGLTHSVLADLHYPMLMEVAFSFSSWPFSHPYTHMNAWASDPPPPHPHYLNYHKHSLSVIYVSTNGKWRPTRRQILDLFVHLFCGHRPLFDNLQEDSEQKRGPCLLWEPLWKDTWTLFTRLVWRGPVVPGCLY